MKPLNFPALWRDTLLDTRALLPLVWPVAAAFVLLPQVATDRFGPPLASASASLPRPAETGVVRAAAPPARAAAQLPALPRIPPNVLLIDLVLPALIGLIAQATIVRLALDLRRGVARTVGEALAAALRAWPLLVATLALGGVPIAVGLLALIVPGFYLAGRLSPAVALVLDGAAPVAALEASWALTMGNGWRVIGFTLVFFGWFVIASAAAGLIGGGVFALLRAAGAGGVGEIVAATLDGTVAALAAVINAVALATVYRHLKS